MRRIIQELREAEEEQKQKPVTWWSVLAAAALTVLFGSSPWYLAADLRMASWAPWPQLLFGLCFVGSLCGLVGTWRGVRNGWTEGQAQAAATTLGCWVFGTPIAIAAIWWGFSTLSSCEAAQNMPWWAAVIIGLLIALLAKRG